MARASGSAPPADRPGYNNNTLIRRKTCTSAGGEEEEEMPVRVTTASSACGAYRSPSRVVSRGPVNDNTCRPRASYCVVSSPPSRLATDRVVVSPDFSLGYVTINRSESERLRRAAPCITGRQTERNRRMKHPQAL